MKKVGNKSIIHHVILYSTIILVLNFLLPDLFPIYRITLMSIATLILISLITSFLISKKRFYDILKSVMNYYFVFIIAILLTYYITTFLVFKEVHGLEQFFINHIATAKLIYFLICVLQNILLPIPEAATIIAGSTVLGSHNAFIIGLIGTLIGVTTMFFITRYGGIKLVSKYVNEKHLIRYQKYTQKNEILYLFALFIVPILPDEIICIGAGLSKITIKRFLVIALTSKVLTTFIFAYSIELAGAFSLTTSQIVLSISIIVIGILIGTLIVKRIKK
ncbi:TVP38/TMEM64 family protein [Bacillus sp. FJAT-45066]|uniref:TVP38/TMEM64 family protein n=1 Tax=Bacillus sp. FJAT-45066 TaxID=2011010 RepID=UPI000BB8ADAE|nr:VTT domain-containing protein [Bacillus sp. FJAT-45066]